MTAALTAAGDAAAWLAALAALFFVPMLVEAGRAARHERQLRARGGIEPAGDVYRIMQMAYPGVFAAMLVEAALGARRVTPTWLVVGLLIFAAGKALKWWAIAALGPFWTFRVIVVPGSIPVQRGPYRLLAHPNYIGVAGELIGAALMTGAVVAGPIGIAGFSALMLRRAAVERRARDAILRRS